MILCSALLIVACEDPPINAGSGGPTCEVAVISVDTMGATDFVVKLRNVDVVTKNFVLSIKYSKNGTQIGSNGFGAGPEVRAGETVEIRTFNSAVDARSEFDCARIELIVNVPGDPVCEYGVVGQECYR